MAREILTLPAAFTLLSIGDSEPERGPAYKERAHALWKAHPSRFDLLRPGTPGRGNRDQFSAENLHAVGRGYGK